jgi:hypothetical protein
MKMTESEYRLIQSFARELGKAQKVPAIRFEDAWSLPNLRTEWFNVSKDLQRKKRRDDREALKQFIAGLMKKHNLSRKEVIDHINKQTGLSS